MQINVSKVTDWQKSTLGKIIHFGAEGHRRIKLKVNTTGPVEVWIAANEFLLEDEESVLIAANPMGMFELEVHVQGDTFLEFRHAEETQVFWAGTAPSHRIHKRDLEAFTTIEPMPSVNTEFQRMMMIMNHNQQQRDIRDQADKQTLLQRIAELETLKAAPAPAPVSEPVLAPSPAPAPLEGDKGEEQP